jgi:hypothetical protein
MHILLFLLRLLDGLFFHFRLRCELKFTMDHGLDTVVHVLHEIDLGATKSAHVRDVVDVVVSFSVLTMSTSDLNMVLVSNGLEFSLLNSEVGQVDVD